MANLTDELRQQKIVAILRGIPDEKADAVIEALSRGGIRFVEMTLNTDGALRIINRWRNKYPEMFIGAGTVLDLEMAKSAAAAGAQYFISPNLDEEVVEYGLSQDIEVWPGVMTPTEAVKAWKAGAPAVKLFPCSVLGGPRFVKELHGPLDCIPMIAVGGVTLDNVLDYFTAGAIAVGLGSGVVGAERLANDDYAGMQAAARAFVEKLQS